MENDRTNKRSKIKHQEDLLTYKHKPVCFKSLELGTTSRVERIQNFSICERGTVTYKDPRNNQHYSNFGSIVRHFRERSGISLRRFAETIGVSPTYISKIERDEYSPPAEDKIVAIADALNINRDDLLAAANRTATELVQIILSRPFLVAELLREIGKMDTHQLEDLINYVKSLNEKENE